MCNSGITQFYLPPTHEPYLPLLASRMMLPPFGWYSIEPNHEGVSVLHASSWESILDLKVYET